MKIVFMAMGLLLWVAPAPAETLTTPAGNRLNWHLPAGWEIAQSPPRALLDEIVRGLEQEARKAKKVPSPQQLERAARSRLAANELLLSHPRSGAWIAFDFSPLHQGEEQPTAESLRLSARYALDSLQNEPGVALSERSRRSFRLPGAEDTQLIFARYRKGQEELVLQGLIGALPGEWFYIYATSYPAKADLESEIEALLNRFRFIP